MAHVRGSQYYFCLMHFRFFMSRVAICQLLCFVGYMTLAQPKTPVFLDHDGGIDDLLSQILILTMEEKELVGVNVIPADCFIEPALRSSHKILQLFDRTDIPLGRSDFYGVNAFPKKWRAEPDMVNYLPVVIGLPEPPDPYAYMEATSLLEKQLVAASTPVEIVITGPPTDLVATIKKRPDLKSKIKQVVWMGGAFRTGGNVKMYQHDGSAEWNAYWDPISTAELFELELPLVCVPLDVTNQVPVSTTFLKRLAEGSSGNIANLAGQLWAMTKATVPSYHYTYFMWDILTTSYIAVPDLFTTEVVQAKAYQRAPREGKTEIVEEGGYKVKIATGVDVDRFYDFLIESFSQPFPNQ